jgi:hypothetical protein
MHAPIHTRRLSTDTPILARARAGSSVFRTPRPRAPRQGFQAGASAALVTPQSSSGSKRPASESPRDSPASAKSVRVATNEAMPAARDLRSEAPQVPLGGSPQRSPSVSQSSRKSVTFAEPESFGPGSKEEGECRAGGEGQTGEGGAKPVETKDDKLKAEEYELTVMSVEVLCAGPRPGKLVPDPEHDGVLAVCYAVSESGRPDKKRMSRGALVWVSPEWYDGRQHDIAWAIGLPKGCEVATFESEAQVFEAFEMLVINMDPDMLVGFEVRPSSIRSHCLPFPHILL